MRLLTLARVLFTFLAFQLGVGLQPAVARAAPARAHHIAQAECPVHNTDGAQPAKSDPSKHDCCKFSGCQNHCGSLPLAVAAIPARIIPDTSLVRPSLATRSPSALPDKLFRPPIAS